MSNANTRTKIVGVRLSPDEYALIQRAAEADMIPTVVVLRRGALAEAESILKRKAA